MYPSFVIRNCSLQSDISITRKGLFFCLTAPINNGQTLNFKTQLTTALANHNEANKTTNQSELEANTCNGRQARENACEQVTIGCGYTSDWLRKWRECFVNQSAQSAVTQNQRKRELLSTLH